MDIIRKPCSLRNYRKGRNGHTISTIVIHLIDGSQAGCDATFASDSLDVVRSAHYSVSKAGEIHQYVEESDTAFHAGRILNPTCPLLKKSDGEFWNPNVYTVGIEHEGRAADAWPDAMYQASADLIADIVRRNPGIGATLSDQNFWMHRQIFSGKSCPGFVADVPRLRKMANDLLAGAPSLTPLASGSFDVTIMATVNIRPEPGTGKPPLGTLGKGTRLKVKSVTPPPPDGRWYEIDDSSANPRRFIWAGATDQP